MTARSLSVTLIVGGVAARAGAAEPDDRLEPQAVFGGTCRPETVGFVDVDLDGAPDLLVQVGSVLYAWRASRNALEPLSWRFDPMQSSGVPTMTATDSGSGVQLTVLTLDEGREAHLSEYLVDPEGPDLDLLWSEVVAAGYWYIGDVDGDGLADLANFGGIRYSRSGEVVPHPNYVPSPEGTNYVTFWVNGVGDMDLDGFDDVLIGARDGGYYYSKLSRLYGPAALVRGSPDGLESEPLWTIWSDNLYEGVGRRFAALPDEDTLVVTVVEEGLLSPDWAPGALGVIHHAGSADASLDQRIPVADLDPAGEMAILLGAVDWDNGSGVLLGEFFTPAGLQRLDFADGSSGSDRKDVAWAPWWLDLDPWIHLLAVPEGRRYGALALRTEVSNDGNGEMLVWGVAREEYGFPDEGVEVDGCTWYLLPYVDPVPSQDTGMSTPPVVVRGCVGCTQQSPAPSSVALLALLGWCAGRWERRSFRMQDGHPSR